MPLKFKSNRWSSRAMAAPTIIACISKKKVIACFRIALQFVIKLHALKIDGSVYIELVVKTRSNYRKLFSISFAHFS